jgi:hypothetical protein
VRLGFGLLLLIVLFVGTAAASCPDCNKRCCSTIRITPLDKNSFCDPQCKVSCEAVREICRRGGPKLPHWPSVIKNVERQLNVSCAAAFQVINQAVIAHQGTYGAGSERMLNHAKQILIDLRLFSESEFENVTIRWARLIGEGQTPDRNTVLISENYQNDLFSTTSILAHEMIHVRQYRRLTTDEFKCRYSRLFLRCIGCQDNRHDLEAEAYAFNEQTNQMIADHIVNARNLAAYIRSQGKVVGSYCATPNINCRYILPVPVGEPCQCNTAQGTFNGQFQ